MRIDLHTHSSVSDGTESPGDVVRSAEAAGLDVVALTDHDSIVGWDEASDAAREVGIEFVPGVELSCRHKGVSIHMLGYWPDAADATLALMMTRTRASRVDRAREIVERLGRDFPVTWEAVASRAETAETVGRPHIADAMVDAGIFERRDDAFAEVLHNNSRYYVPHYAPEVLDGVRAILSAGGVPVFAHPGADSRGHIVPASVIEGLAAAGLAGLEVDHRDHSPAQRERLSGMAARLGLVVTGASDYHGAGKQNRLGENLTSPESFAALLREARP